MSATLRIALTADLHWATNPRGDAATLQLLTSLRADPPDVLVLAGDVGAAEHFAECLALFDDLPCRKALVPGNHDIWVRPDDERGDSLAVYRDYLPRVCTAHDLHYLDHEPLVFPEANLALVGSINWYDYSWALDNLRRLFPGEEERLRTKRFTRGRHNDANFVRWPFDDERFTADVVAVLRKHLQQEISQERQVVVVTHHPSFYGLNYPRPTPPVTLDGLLWDAFSGNRGLEALLAESADHVPFAFCGHTHRARENTLGAIRGYNIGGDYHFKRLLWLDWPARTVREHTFGDPTP